MADISASPRDERRDRRTKFAGRRAKAYAAIAKYSVLALSTLIVFFPSTHTFIKPPYVFDTWILLPSLACALIAFYFSARTVIGAELDEDKIPVYSEAQKNGQWAVVFTSASIFLVIVYVFLNVRHDRTSVPEITRMTVSPINPLVSNNVQIEAHARDEDNDVLRWQWSVRFENEDFSNLDSSISTAFWIPHKAGKFTIRAIAADDTGSSLSREIRIVIRDHDGS